MKAKDIAVLTLIVMVIVYQSNIIMKYYQNTMINDNNTDLAQYEEERTQIRKDLRHCEMKLLQKSSDHNSTTTTNSSSSSTSSSSAAAASSSDGAVVSQFDIIAKTLYDQATRPKIVEERQRFSLEGWSRGSGGLDDQDRLALGELYFHANSVFEFGLGESTYIAAKVSVPRYAGVDSDANWVSDARNKAALMNAKHFRFYFADIGKTLAWGYPAEKMDKNLYNYQVQSLDTEKGAFDVYYVDGRYRVACACISFLHAMKYGADMSRVRVGTHDNERADYHALQEIGDVVVQNTKLWVYKLKDGITEEDIAKLYDKVMDVTHR